MHEDGQRAHLNAAEKLAVIEQLSLLGLSPSQIVRRTKAPKQTVEDAPRQREDQLPRPRVAIEVLRPAALAIYTMWVPGPVVGQGDTLTPTGPPL